jgi:hypothetical protein
VLNSELQLDKAETLLAHLLCADRAKVVTGANEAMFARFEPMKPGAPYTAQLSGDRIFSTSPVCLLETVQDLLGNKSEVALMGDDYVKWIGLRKLNKAPRGCWASVMRPTWYEYHFMLIRSDGTATYDRDVIALKSDGNPAKVMFQGFGTRGGHVDESSAICAITAASLVEDAHRPGALLATVSDGASVLVPVPTGEHKELFALRDAPLTKAGKRKAILHWVVRHTRATKQERVNVSEHWRGTRTLSIDGLSVMLAPNARLTGPQRPAQE